MEDSAVESDVDPASKPCCQPPQREGQPLIIKSNTWQLRVRQVLAASGPVVATLSSGMTSGFSAVLLPQLTGDASDFRVTPEETSWVASAAVLPMALGCILSGYMMEQYGRRLTQLLVCTVAVTGWVVLSLATNIAMLCCGRILTGLSVGILGPTSIVYIAETSDPRFRGTVLASIPLAVSAGILCSHVLGTMLNWKTAAAICALFPFIGYIMLYPAPESPTWLVGQGKLTEAEHAFFWLRGCSKKATAELSILFGHEKTISALSKSKFDKETIKLLLAPSFLKPFIIMNAFFFIQQFSGANAVIFYSVDILGKLTSNVNNYLATFIIDVVRVIMSGLTCILLKKICRRSLAIFSAAGTCLSLFALAVSIHYLPPQLTWLNVPLITTYICFISVGVVPLPWIMIGEVFPASLREIGSGSTSCFGFLMFFLVVKTSPILISTLDISGAFATYGVVAFIGVLFLYFCLLLC